MRLDPSCLDALRIFRTDLHPSSLIRGLTSNIFEVIVVVIMSFILCVSLCDPFVIRYVYLSWYCLCLDLCLYVDEGLSGSKEGLSVLGVLDRTVTAGGRAMLRRWLSQPLASRHSITERLNAVGLFAAVEHKSFVEEICAALKRVGRLPDLIANMKVFLCCW